MCTGSFLFGYLRLCLFRLELPAVLGRAVSDRDFLYLAELSDLCSRHGNRDPDSAPRPLGGLDGRRNTADFLLEERRPLCLGCRRRGHTAKHDRHCRNRHCHPLSHPFHLPFPFHENPSVPFLCAGHSLDYSLLYTPGIFCLLLCLKLWDLIDDLSTNFSTPYSKPCNAQLLQNMHLPANNLTIMPYFHTYCL